MSVPSLVSQSSWDLSVYLPSNIDPAETSHFISSDALLCSFNLDPSLLAHRTESEPFYPGAKDNEVMSLMDDGCTMSIIVNEPDKNDIGEYICRHSEVKPVEPSKIQRKNWKTNRSLLPSSPHKGCKARSNENVFSISELHLNSIDVKKFLVYDKTTGRQRRPLLHEFIRIILETDEYSHLAEYIDRKSGIFKLYQPDQISQLWQYVKGRNSDNDMTYGKLSRAIRYYYRKGIMTSSPGRFTFGFGPKSGFGSAW